MCRNMQEVPGNGVDDDENGYADDFHGASVIGSSFSHSGDPADDTAELTSQESLLQVELMLREVWALHLMPELWQ